MNLHDWQKDVVGKVIDYNDNGLCQSPDVVKDYAARVLGRTINNFQGDAWNLYPYRNRSFWTWVENNKIKPGDIVLQDKQIDMPYGNCFVATKVEHTIFGFVIHGVCSNGKIVVDCIAMPIDCMGAWRFKHV